MTTVAVTERLNVVSQSQAKSLQSRSLTWKSLINPNNNWFTSNLRWINEKTARILFTPCSAVVSFDKKLHSLHILSFSSRWCINTYPRTPSKYGGGGGGVGDTAMDKHPVHSRSTNTPSCFTPQKPGQTLAMWVSCGLRRLYLNITQDAQIPTHS